jgi:hypothetical protein
LISMLARRSSTWESTTAPSARRSIKPKCSFTSFPLYVIQLFLRRAYLYIGIMCLWIDHGNESWFRGMCINILLGSFEPYMVLSKYRVVINLVICHR